MAQDRLHHTWRERYSEKLKVDSNGNNRFRFRPSNHLLGEL